MANAETDTKTNVNLMSPMTITKRKFTECDSNSTVVTNPQSLQLDLPKFNLTPAKRSRDDDDDNNNDPERDSEKKDSEQCKKRAKKIPKQNSPNYPAITFSKECRLQSQIKISDLQSLILYILADGSSPQFVSVRHRPQIRKVVVLMVPGLEMSMFIPQEQKPVPTSPDYYYPIKLQSDKLPEDVRLFADMFEHIWPVKTPGDDRFMKMYSPLHAMLIAPTSKSKEEKQEKKRKKGATPVKEPQGWKNNRVPVTEFILTLEELIENEYIVHPAMYEDKMEKLQWEDYRRVQGVSEDHGWVDTRVDNLENGTPPESEIETGSITAGRELLAMDCEMCMTGESEFSLTRISIVRWDGSVVLDELVKPEKPITNYVTQYSGITKKMLENVTTTLKDIQKKLLEILHPRTILIGHSLNADLTALKITHPFIIDTVVLFPHPRGPPLKPSLKWLTQRYLNREIQKGHGATGPGAGHDSIEDAKACLDLVKQKCEKGKDWGTSETRGEIIFKRISRSEFRHKGQITINAQGSLKGRSSAAVDWGNPKKGPGAAADFTISCKSDEEIVNGIIRAIKGDHDGKEIPGGGVDFVWGRLRELEALKGWWNNNRSTDVDSTPKIHCTPSICPESDQKDAEVDASEKNCLSSTATLPESQVDTTIPVSQATAELTRRISKIYSALPPCTAFLIYSGSGSPLEMSRLQTMQTRFRQEYKTKKWDQLSVKWTDVEEQALRKACSIARNGIGFVGIK
ncbi:putative exonuclease [Podosphaera aphanis]|nr:putative exonuclease [Podosphaera aphanis]